MRNSLPGTPFSERDQAMQPTQWKSWGMSGGLKSGAEIRNPKPENRRKSEIREPKSEATGCG